MDDNAIVVEGLSRKFKKQEALKGIDLTVKKGQVYGFIGPNGAGKSTAIRILTTLLLPTQGSATILGLDVIKQPRQVKLKIGAALQELSLDPKQTGTEMMTLQGRLYGLKSGEIKRRIDELSPLMDIGDAVDRLTGTYSGGMKRRLDLALSMMHQPEVLFLDEPTTGLDPVSRQRVWEQIREINEKLGITVFLTTQYLEEADELTDRISIIDDGLIVVEGTPEELKHTVGADILVVKVQDDTVEQAIKVAQSINGVQKVENYGDELSISTSDGPRMVSAVALKLNEANVNVSEITLRTPTLDDVFLKYTGVRIQQRHEQQQAAEEAEEAPA